jgi:Na+-translocating ferredoxin:NAD+ oxidoreductase RnfG subunit
MLKVVLKKNILLILLVSVSIIGKAAKPEWSPMLAGKVTKALSAVYHVEDFTFEPVELIQITDEAIKSALNKRFYKVFSEGEFKGYAYVAQAPSMKNVFDYLVIFNKELSIKKTKVLIYREQHGRQIGTARWLSQFTGMNTEDRPYLGGQVDGISGATISAKSMTMSVSKVLAVLATVKEQGYL